jgi:hypothetical protein
MFVECNAFQRILCINPRFQPGNYPTKVSMKSTKMLLKWLVGGLLITGICIGGSYFVLSTLAATALWDTTDEWSIENEPWNAVSIPIPDETLEVIYWEQHAHPFLAEYYRKIEIKPQGKEPSTLEMPVNTGGQTLINVYTDQNLEQTKVLILKDQFGIYILQMAEQTFTVDPAGIIFHSTQYLGRIEYQAGVLTFIPETDSPEMIIETSE